MPPPRPHPPDPERWFGERVRPLVAYAPDAADARWRRAGVVPAPAELEALVARAEAQGTPPRVALTWVAGWQVGAGAVAAAIGVLRDGLLLRDGLELLVHSDGWVGDARVRGDAAAERGADDLPEAFAGLLAERWGPLIGTLADRSGRGRAGLWAQVADAVGGAAGVLLAADADRPPGPIVAATRRLLDTPGAPWRARPELRIPADGQRPALVVHRGSCCLAYRCDPPGYEELDPGPVERAFRARFGDDPPRYCDTCLFRDAADVDARARRRADPAATHAVDVP